MADIVTQTTTTGFLSRIVNSIVGVVFGFLLFFASFGVLYWNEGRPSNYEVYKTAVETSSSSVDSSKNGKLVYANDKLTTNDMLSSGTEIKPDKYLALKKTVEVYSWIEDQKSNSNSNTGGSQTTTTTYTYKKDWTNNPQDSSTFQELNGHTNLPKRIDDETKYAQSATFGAFTVDVSQIGLPEMSKVALSSETSSTTVATPAPTMTAVPTATGTTTVTPTVTTTPVVQDSSLKEYISNKDYIFWGTGTFESPNVGDIRISYTAIKSPIQVTIFGKQDENSLVSYTSENDVKVFRAFTQTHDDALTQVKTEDAITTWVLRAVGFIMMWMGMTMMLAPLATVSDIIPILGQVTGFVLGLITFVVAAILSVITIVISLILHNIFAMVIIALIAIGLVAFFWSRKNNKNLKPAV